MSPKEPAIKLLRERYKESFGFTEGSNSRIHLFLVKLGLWALVYTFVPKDLQTSKREILDIKAGSGQMTMNDALSLTELALTDRNPELLSKLDYAVSKALSRIESKAREFGIRT